MEVTRTSLDWVAAHRDGFRLGPDALDPAADVNRSWKPLGELAQVCARVRSHGAPGGPARRIAGELLDFAWRETGEGALLLDLQRLEPAATYPLEVYAVFASAGYRHPGYEELAGSLVRTRSWRATEMHPNRRLGVRNAERRAGLRSGPAPFPAAGVSGAEAGPYGVRPGPAADAVRPDGGPTDSGPTDPAGLDITWLGALPEPWLFERAAGYTLTHVVFHLTDWGRWPRGIPPGLAGYLDDWLPAWLDGCLDDEQWDLGCELLAVAASLPDAPAPGRSGHPPRPAALRSGPETARSASVWSLLAGARDAGGAIPEVGPGSQGGPVPRDFAHCYHSTLMAVFAGTLVAARFRRDPAPAGREGPS
ncbi:DUF6895 family protein [Streptomyces pyxinae]|uniref:DUF6895 family protein n=1 Tax=Streptomyces pyxinae TaxID=2970734 RepID=UPI003D1736C9